MIKNMGLNIGLLETDTRWLKPKSIDWDNWARKAKEDFADYANQQQYRCKVYLCNWEGLEKDLTWKKCPVCGNKVSKIKRKR